MSNTEYTGYLNRLELVLPKWEDRIGRVDAEKLSGISYQTGKMVMDERQLVLMQFANIRTWIREEHESPKVSRELAISVALGSVFDGFGDISAMLPGNSEVNAWFGNDPKALFGEIGEYRIRLSNHVQAGIERLEAKNCR
jgi:hypothetical protein